MNAVGIGPRIRIAAFLIYTGLLSTATHIPNDALPPINIRWFDKLEHLAAYGLWTLLLFASGLLGTGSFNQRAAKALSWCLLYAIAEELLQMIPILNRVGDPLDVLADLLGSVCAVCAVWAWERKRKSHPEQD